MFLIVSRSTAQSQKNDRAFKTFVQSYGGNENPQMSSAAVPAGVCDQRDLRVREKSMGSQSSWKHDAALGTSEGAGLHQELKEPKISALLS